MTKSMRVAGATLAMGSVLLASACGSGGSGKTSSTSSTPSTSTTSTPPSSSSSTTSPTSSPTTNPNSSMVRARALVDRYYAVSDHCLFDPQNSPMTCFDSVAISSELDQLRNTLGSAQTAHTKQIGSTQVVWAKQIKVDLTNKPKETPPSIPIVTYSVCYDVSKVNIVDYHGNSIVPAERKPRAIETIAVVNYRYPKPAGWRVGYTTPTGKPC